MHVLIILHTHIYSRKENREGREPLTARIHAHFVWDKWLIKMLLIHGRTRFDWFTSKAVQSWHHLNIKHLSVTSIGISSSTILKTNLPDMTWNWYYKTFHMICIKSFLLPMLHLLYWAVHEGTPCSHLIVKGRRTKQSKTIKDLAKCDKME